MFNDKYKICNNGYTMYLVRGYLSDSFILEGDVYLTKNFLSTDIDKSTYFSSVKEDFDSE